MFNNVGKKLKVLGKIIFLIALPLLFVRGVLSAYDSILVNGMEGISKGGALPLWIVGVRTIFEMLSVVLVSWLVFAVGDTQERTVAIQKQLDELAQEKSEIE